MKLNSEVKIKIRKINKYTYYVSATMGMDKLLDAYPLTTKGIIECVKLAIILAQEEEESR